MLIYLRGVMPTDFYSPATAAQRPQYHTPFFSRPLSQEGVFMNIQSYS